MNTVSDIHPPANYTTTADMLGNYENRKYPVTWHPWRNTWVKSQPLCDHEHLGTRSKTMVPHIS